VNSSSLGVPDNNKAGLELRAKLLALPHHVKRVISAEGKENRQDLDIFSGSNSNSPYSLIP